MPGFASASAPAAAFVWTDQHGFGRNVWSLFRQTVHLKKIPTSAVIHLFAESRYRLRVNGHFAAYGPARSLPSHPEYDSVDIRPWLLRGENVVTVEANSFGTSSFETMPSPGGFIAWGECGGQSLATPGAWKSRQINAWERWAPPFSFAQGPVEICDFSRLPEAWFLPGYDDSEWVAPSLHQRPDCWGPLRPCPLPPPDYRSFDPVATTLCSRLRDDEERIGFRLDEPYHHFDGKPPRVAFASCLWSPRAQKVKLGLFWGPHYLNGEELEQSDNHALGNRQEAVAALRKGWNLLYGQPEALLEAWAVLVSYPKASGIIAASEPTDHPLGQIRHTGLLDPRRLPSKPPATFAELPSVPGGWRAAGSDRHVIPAREMAWDVPTGKPERSARVEDIEIPASLAGHTVVYDFGREFIGQVFLDLESAPGTLVDIAVDEVLHANGSIEHYRNQFNVNAADRYIARGGRSGIEAVRPRGGRYVQVTVRNASAPAILHRVAVRSLLRHPPRLGAFACSEDVLEWAWEAGAHTIEASTEDAWVDPWRERGLYLGDALVEYHAAAVLSPDTAIAKRCIRLWAESQKPDGQMYDVVPSWKQSTLHDYSLIWIILLRDYWADTGDRAFVKAMFAHIRRVLESPAWVAGPSGLWDATTTFVFVDWAITSEGRIGENGVLNAFRIGALTAAAQLARAIGHTEAAAEWEGLTARVKKMFQVLWDDKHQRYAPSRIAGKLSKAPALHTNVLALAYGIAPKGREASVLAYVLRGLATNHLIPKDRIELYFLYYALSALYDRGLAGEAERVMHAHYSRLKARGAWAVWECIERGLANKGSLCHGWAASPTIFLSRRALGVRPAVPGARDRIVIAPESELLDWARGVVPHAKGPIEIEWKTEGDALRYRLVVPKGLKFEFAPRGRLAKLCPVRER